VILQAASKDISTLELADPSLFDDRQFMIQVAALDATAVTYASHRLLEDPAFRDAAVRANSMTVHYFISTDFNPSLQAQAEEQDAANAAQKPL
jgi:hypothetical protein